MGKSLEPETVGVSSVAGVVVDRLSAVLSPVQLSTRAVMIAARLHAVVDRRVVVRRKHRQTGLASSTAAEAQPTALSVADGLHIAA